MQPARVLYHLLHEVICTRKLALPELIDRTCVEGVYMEECQDPMISQYLRDFARLARSYLRAQTASKIALVIYSKEFKAIERWTFTLTESLSTESLAGINGLQALINQIRASNGYLDSIPPGATFRVLAYLDDSISLTPFIRAAADVSLPGQLQFRSLQGDFTLETQCHI